MSIFWVGDKHDGPAVQTYIHKGKHVMINSHNPVAERKTTQNNWFTSLYTLYSNMKSVHGGRPLHIASE